MNITSIKNRKHDSNYKKTKHTYEVACDITGVLLDFY